MYAVVLVPLIRHLSGSVSQVWYVEDASMRIGKLPDLHHWWDKLCKEGSSFGYFPNAYKTWLVVKDRCHSEAETMFASTN